MINVPWLIRTGWAVLSHKHAAELFKHSAEFFKHSARLFKLSVDLLVSSSGFKFAAERFESSVERLNGSARCVKTSAWPGFSLKKVFVKIWSVKSTYIHYSLV